MQIRVEGSPPAFKAESWKPAPMFVVNRWYERSGEVEVDVDVDV